MAARTGGGEFGERFSILRRLGEGGMGVVYEAFDHERQSHVALKTIRFPDAATVYRFKNEFRALADVVHPNLAALHELVASNGQTFFTMELVQGVDLLQYVSFGAEAVFAETISAPMRVEAPASEAAPGSPLRTDRALACDLARLRDALPQLGKGVAALHAAGKLHRDIKPSNVLVTVEGRVVLLDFGLVTDLASEGVVTLEHQTAGTAEYMSPEQAAGSELTEASDWYSVGTILFQALTGRLPYLGQRLRILMDKQQFDPPVPSALVDGVPPELELLCVELLARDPKRRPSGREVLRRLGVRDDVPVVRAASTHSTHTAPFLGRGPHGEFLADAFAGARDGRAIVATVHGSSGMGKSVLVRRFLDGLVQRGEAIVLAGRCYERESVPYKAVDSIVDALSHHLRRLPRAEADALLPREVLALARVFPVLMRVEAIAAAPRRAVEIPDPQELRRRAFAALRELLTRVAIRRPLVLWIDDLQWSDADSGAILVDLLRAPDPPPIFLVASYRTEDAATSPVLRTLVEARARGELGAELRELKVAALTRDEARDLADALLGGEPGEHSEQAAVIAEESQGIPFFVAELVRHLQSGQTLRWSPGERPRLDDVLLQRVATLPDDAQRLLEVIAVAGRPVARAVATEAAKLAGDREATALALLRTGHLVRSVQTTNRYQVETYHDRVREAVVGALEATALREHHRRIALALLATGHDDAEALAVHFQGAGEHERAGEYQAAAASKAAEALAFDRAAMLYRRSLELRPLGGDEGRALRWKLADALANAGRGADAAQEYLAAAVDARAGDALELHRRAAEQLLFTGHVDEGLAAMDGVLQRVGMHLPPSPRRALLSLIWNVLRLALRGLRFRSRDVSQISKEALTRIDVCWSVNTGIAMFDPIVATDFQKRHALLALQTGEPYRVARALATEVVVSALPGPTRARRTARILAEAQRLAETTGSAHARGFVQQCAGLAAFLEGRWKDARELCDRALRTLREECTGVAWEIATTELFRCWALWRLGELPVLCRDVSALLGEAQERGDLYLRSSVRTGITNGVWLVADDVDRAEEEVAAALAMHPAHREVPLQRYYVFSARTQIDLYAGRGDAAWARLLEEWPKLRRSMIFRVQNVRIEALQFRALAALAVTTDRIAARRIAAREVRRLERETMRWPVGTAKLVRAALAVDAGDVPRACALLDEAARLYDDDGLPLYAAAARRRRGALIGGVEGRAAIEAADAQMRAAGVVAPVRFARVLAPGFPEEA